MYAEYKYSRMLRKNNNMQREEKCDAPYGTIFVGAEYSLISALHTSTLYHEVCILSFDWATGSRGGSAQICT